MPKSSNLTIKDWQTGIAESPHVGFGQMVNVDIFTQPGSVRISQRLIPSDNINDVLTGFIIWFVENPRGDVYAVDTDGKLYKWDYLTHVWSVLTGHGAGGHGEGLGIWKGYLFYARSTRIDVMFMANETWTNDWAPAILEPTLFYHPMLAAQDDHFYIGNGNFVDTVVWNGALTGPFDPNNFLTYTYNDHQLRLADFYQVTCLEQLSDNIAIGTQVGETGNINIADTFFWNGGSKTFNSPSTIRFAENGVWQMKNMGNTLFTVAGTGLTRLFASFTAQAQEVKRFNSIHLPPHTTLKPYPGAIDQREGELFIGVGKNISTDITPMGVYSYRKGAYTVRHLISTGEDGANDTLQIGAIKTVRPDFFFVSWQDDNSSPQFGVDMLSANFYKDYEAYIESPLYEVGSDDDPKTYEKIEVRMGKDLKTGDGIRVSARYALESPYVQIAEFTTPDYLGKTVFDRTVSNLGYFKNIQFRIELTTDEDSEESPELREIILQ